MCKRTKQSNEAVCPLPDIFMFLFSCFFSLHSIARKYTAIQKYMYSFVTEASPGMVEGNYK